MAISRIAKGGPPPTAAPAGRPVELTASGRTIAFERDAAGRGLVRRMGETVSLARRFAPKCKP